MSVYRPSLFRRLLWWPVFRLLRLLGCTCQGCQCLGCRWLWGRE